MPDEIKPFFSQLSERFTRENSLSDITYCLCNSNQEFKELFLKFHFPNINLSQPIEMYREYSIEDSRPDLVIHTPNEKYLIEVKIYDRKQHFKQYIKTFKDYTRSYITNYEIEKEEKNKYKDYYNFCTWKEFVEFLEEQTSNEIIHGYIQYVKQVCIIKEIKDMRFNNLQGLYYFNTYVTELIKESAFDNLTLKEYSTKSNFSDSWSGKYFEMYKIHADTSIYPWFGVIYDENNVSISVDFSFDKGWCDLLSNKSITLKKKDYCEISKDSSAININLKESRFNEIQNTDDVEKQKSILKSFFEEVINNVSEYL